MKKYENDGGAVQYTDEPPPSRPSRTRSQSRGTSQPDDDRTSRGAESLLSENQAVCVEETCIKDIRDPMGYAIIDKQKVRDPPLPPPRTPPRKRRSIQSNKSGSSETKFSTVPRTHGDDDDRPVRPLRNYSTLGPSRPPRNKSIPNLTDEEKENIDISQYIEIEEEPAHRLQSGEVLQKMRDRPLPAPPRPPRKGRTLHDITQDENVPPEQEEPSSEKSEELEEMEVSTQTEALPDGLVCEEQNRPKREIHLETPTQYSFEETVTHGSLIVEPLNGAQIIPENQFSRIETRKERIIPVQYENDDEDETSEVPEEFHRLVDPSPSVVNTGQSHAHGDTQSDDPSLFKAQKLQVHDLDVNRLTVNELLANKIIVSEIDGITIHANEISSKSGAVKINQIELPHDIVQQLVEKLQISREQSTSEELGTATVIPESQTTVNETSKATKSEQSVQKKTPIEQNDFPDETVEPQPPPPQRPPRQNGSGRNDDVLSSQATDSDNNVFLKPEDDVESTTFQLPAPSNLALPDTNEDSIITEQETQEKDPSTSDDRRNSQQAIENDEPPPRPPRPSTDYVPSQPPASFYALRAQKYTEYFDDDIPLPPRRSRRHQKITVSKSSSDETTPPAVVSTRRRLRTPEPSIPQLTGQLVRACGTASDRCIKRLISHITDNVLNNSDGQQDMHVMIVILLILIAGLILLGFGEGRTTIHHHHWEFFFPPQDL